MWICTACDARLDSKEAIASHHEHSPQCWDGCSEVDLGFGWVKPACSPVAALNVGSTAQRRSDD